MHRCICPSPVAFALDGVPHILTRTMEDVADDHPLVKAAPWAFDKVPETEDDDEDEPVRRPRRRRAAEGSDDA